MKRIFPLFVIALFSSLVIAWCTNSDRVQVWDTVSITYSAHFPDGELFDSNTPEAPLMFTVGSGNVIKGLDNGVLRMKEGKKKTITITPEEGYGELYAINNIQKVAKFVFDELNILPETGSIQTIGTIKGIIRWIESDEYGNAMVLFDVNPRETRDTLTYTITLLAKMK